ncbi:phosphoenolpyruvate--protein phosphotransferase [candidate division CSSED10-310 bacterium]|uniref:Phosphoenolpyruvate-protein phosphotransferase n=1 Tax=candidate division CSSED10-310 bacterium TaxID=2855610 RepID=A0ABV6Z2W7_UNCC1
MLKGIGVSPGIAIGKAYLFRPERANLPKYTIKKEDIPTERERFNEALHKSEQQLMDIKQQLSERRLADHVHIFDAHMLILHDRSLWKDIFDLMHERLVNLEWALDIVREIYTTIFSQIQDEVFRDKRSDIHDVIDRLIDNLVGSDRRAVGHIPPDSIIFAHDLAPSVTVCLDLENLKAFVTEIGGKTAHVAILARALEIPAVAGLENILTEVKDGEPVIIDGSTGEVIIQPSKAILKDYTRRHKRERRREQQLMKSKDLPAETTDGYRIELAANIELLREVPSVFEHGAEAIGLYRTEFLYMNQPALPSEDEHFTIYRELAQAMYPRKAVIRTLDAGGDKFLSDVQLVNGMKDFMGLRAIRLCFKMIDLFKAQLRGILRANTQENLKIMFPMISGLDEIRKAKDIYYSVRDELSHEGYAIHDMEIGIMIEIPSTAFIADALAAEVDFFSIGTNDLIQYALAIDRVNKEVAYLYEPLHPAIIRIIHNVVQTAHQHGIWVGVCGEMAGEPFYTPVLVGMGVDELSMNAHSIPRIKEIIRNISFSEAQHLTDTILKTSDIPAIKSLITHFLLETNPKFAELIPS